MAASIQLSREELCDGLDNLVLQQLKLMDQLIKCNMMLEEMMRGGFFLLTKTRYTMGISAVSSLQLPTPESQVDSLASVMSTPVVLEDYSGDIMYHRVDTRFKDPVVLMTDSPEEEGETNGATETVNGEQALRRRVFGTLAEKEESTRSRAQKSKKSVNRDPIRWFSALPPLTLKQAQHDFKAAVSMVAECATMQLKLRTVNKEYKRLYDIKRKLDRAMKEE